MRMTLLTGLALALAVVLPGQATKDKGKEKSAGDLAAEAYFKLRDAKEAPVTSDRLQKVMGAGLAYLSEHPGHGRVGSVINSLATFSGTMRDKKLAPLASWWLSQLKYEVVNRRMQAGASDELRLVWASLGTAVAGHEARASRSKELLAAFREQIDRLAEMPGAARFLSGHEREFVGILYELNRGGGEAYARKLSDHADKKVAAMARDEVRLMEARRTPLELKFTALDGREVDVAQLRGKAVLLFFWSAGNEASLSDLAALAEVYRNYKLEFEIVTVCLDLEADRPRVLAAAKKFKWPVWFDGAGTDNATGAKLNVRSPPAGFLFNQQGLLVAPGLRANKVEGEVKKVLGVK